MRKIDAHSHPDFCNVTFEGVLRDMEENEIEKICLLSWENPLDENYPGYRETTPSAVDDSVQIPFHRCLSYYERAPEKFILGYAPDPRVPGTLMKFRGAVKTYNIKMCGEVKFRMMYDNPDAIELFRLCGEYGIPVTLHLDDAEVNRCGMEYPRPHYWYGGDIETLERVLKKCPETNFLGHAPGFWAYISDDEQSRTVAYPMGSVIPGGKIERFLEEYPNLYCDCSATSCLRALSRDVDYTKKLIETYSDKFIFARDEFTNRLDSFIKTLGLSDDVLEKFYHWNLESLIGL